MARNVAEPFKMITVVIVRGRREKAFEPAFEAV